ncbi:DNA-binding CsgD family transcriptional regulator [Nonomuraea muscovyensis]|uniref:DNA-binding CsgD family transcriptional regulator n=1 Tax=Nonomuraea muscovyensis TaxID=1124761 RepID=A0A7X0C6X7_9ACTN|nr:LuxR family transcriptional regulator [Nonomuraea muscovyensis]MBB6347894.1 DNA-binding CsgD family transcriptional regulator [Nonomuraea muscovyensis]
MRVLRGSGIESASELPFAALQMLLRPLLDDLDTLPKPQAEALRGALGLTARTTEPDRFLIGLATLTLLAEHSPLLCLVDDAHWIDHASSQALLFAARRLDVEGVVLLFATRGSGGDVFAAAGLPDLMLAGLDRESALQVLAEHAPGLPGHVRDRIVAEAGGNPLALIELPGMDTDSLAAGPLPLPHRLQEAYQERITALPSDTRTLLLALAVEDLPAALQATGLPVDALAPAEREGLITVTGAGAAFRHPLVRAAAYQGAPFAERAAIHRALARAVGDDRRAWHLAAAATGPDEPVAAALEHAARQARRLSGHAEASAALERAARLTATAPDRARRLTAAAELAADSGRLDRARALIDQAVHLGGTSAERVRLRARIEFGHGSPEAAWRLLLDAAPDNEDLLVEAARVAWSVGDTAGLRAVKERLARDDGLAALIAGTIELLSGDPGAGLDLLRRHTADAPERRVGADGLRIGATSLALLSGDLRDARENLLRLSDGLRSGGAIGLLPGALAVLAESETLLGLTRQAASTAAEALRIAQDTGQHRHASHAGGLLAFLAALRGEEPSGEGDWAGRARAMLDLGRGRFEAALDRFEALACRPQGVYFTPDQVEAAVRSGRPERAPIARWESWAEASGRQWAQAVRHRCLALLADDPEEHFEQAVVCPDLPFQEARSRLLNGEWLRRSRRKNEARRQLRAALELFEQAGAVPWADHARTELRAAGESAASPSEDLLARLTSQELQIVRLAATGATNKEIGAQLFLSPKTVGHHLYRAFPKLGVSNRTELARLNLLTQMM